jgi:hypothetical protein
MGHVRSGPLYGRRLAAPASAWGPLRRLSRDGVTGEEPRRAREVGDAIPVWRGPCRSIGQAGVLSRDHSASSSSIRSRPMPARRGFAARSGAMRH